MDVFPTFTVKFDVTNKKLTITAEGDVYRVIRDVEGEDDWVRFMYRHKNINAEPMMYEIHTYKKRNGNWSVSIYPVYQEETNTQIEVPLNLLILY